MTFVLIFIKSYTNMISRYFFGKVSQHYTFNEKGGDYMNVNLLRSKMVAYGDKVVDLAKELGITRNALYCKLSQIYEFKQSEISIIKKRYKLTNEEVIEIFL